jgi:hypothetical protein
MTIQQSTYEQQVQLVANETRNLSTLHAMETGTAPDAFLRDVIAELQTVPVHSRAKGWHARFRIYTADDAFSDVLWDSDRELAADQPGATIFAGLPAVTARARELAIVYHGLPLQGVTNANLTRKVTTLRTYLSNGQHSAGTMRIPYSTYGSVVKHWLMRIDVERAADNAPSTAPSPVRKPFRREV